MSATDYSDYAKDRSGWFFGLSGAQLALVVITGMPELAALNSHNWLLIIGWLPMWGVLVALVAVPVRGWSASQWLLALASHALGGLMGWTRWQSKVAAATVTDLDEAVGPRALIIGRSGGGKSRPAGAAVPLGPADSAEGPRG